MHAFTIDEMKNKYAALWSSLGLTLASDNEGEFERLVRTYSGERRRYHTLQHIGWGLRRIDEMAADDRTRGGSYAAGDWDRIRWAFWYHDFVLEGSPDDEAASADMAGNCALHAGLGMAFAQDVMRLVRATGHEKIPLRTDEAIICDADLSILGAHPEHFDHYEMLVREEWAHVPMALFAAARAVILKRFVERPWIYMTDYARTRWERQARTNLATSLSRLGSAEHTDWVP